MNPDDMVPDTPHKLQYNLQSADAFVTPPRQQYQISTRPHSLNNKKNPFNVIKRITFANGDEPDNNTSDHHEFLLNIDETAEETVAAAGVEQCTTQKSTDSTSTPSSTSTTPSKTSKIEFIDLAKRRLSSGQFKADLLPYLSIFKSPSKRREST